MHTKHESSIAELGSCSPTPAETVKLTTGADAKPLSLGGPAPSIRHPASRRWYLAPRRCLVLVGLAAQLSILNPQPIAAQSPPPDSFDPGAGGSYPMVYSMAVEPAGRVLVGGSFNTLGGQPRNYLGRLHADGTLDSTFNPEVETLGGLGPYLYSLTVQSDGRILVGGTCTLMGGQPRNYFGRLNADGMLDDSFDPRANGVVYSVVLQADRKTLVGGGFTALGGQARTNIARLNADGTVDATFHSGAGPSDNYGSSVSALAMQADGKILVGGSFNTLGGSRA